MTTKDYAAVAAILSRRQRNMPHSAYAAMVGDFVHLFAADNPRFRADLFRMACGVEG